VGYGDVVPKTPLGKLAAAAVFFVGIILGSIPISVISVNFSGEYKAMKRLAAARGTHAAVVAMPAAAPAGAARETAGFQPALEDGGGGGDAAAAVAGMGDAQRRVATAWSEPFLRSALQVTRDSRRTLMAALKRHELVSRELAAADLEAFLADVGSLDRATAVVRRASVTGLA